VVFSCVFVPALAASLSYVYLRPAEYRAVARLQIAPAAAVTQPTVAKDTPTVATDAKSFLTEVQVLTSRPLLQDVLRRLNSDGPKPDPGADPVDAMQRMLHAEPIAGTQVVELSAEGRQQDLVARLVNTVVEAYRQHVADVYKGSASSTYGAVNDEVSALGKEVAAKREAIDAFRARYDIVSIEHKENDVLAQIEGLSQSYTDANQRRAKAQARLQALRNSVAAGKAVVRPKDDPTLVEMTQRASELRERWRELQRRYTANYLAMDPDARSVQARLESLEEQLKTQRAASERAALAEAEEEVAAAQAAVEGLRQSVSDNQKEAQEFATHLNEYKTLRGDLDHIEEMHRAGLDRLTKMQASERERAPRVELVEAAAPSLEPWWPNYRKDALIAVGGSLIFGLFAAWFADFIAGPLTSPAMVMQHWWSPAVLGRDVTSAPLALAAPGVAQLHAPAPVPRELGDAEIAALIAATTDDARLAVVALLIGISAEELVALRWDEIDLSAEAMHVGGETRRVVPLQDPLRSLLVARQRVDDTDAEGTVLHDAQGARLVIEEVERLVLYSAYDAGLDRPQEVTSDALRYTYLAFLLRQGIRAADIPGVAGYVTHNELVVYMQSNSPKARRPLQHIDRLLPALRELGGRGSDEAPDAIRL
jgi:uncharacterized protein involved in exopolysaccharide biosynthesis